MSEYEKNLARLRSIASEKQLVLNPDEARVQKVVGLMTENFTAVGEYVCPCKQQNKPPVKGADTLCPCPEIMDEVSKEGHCFCRLFFTPEAAAAT
jgi:ferredoxin-thioredoxin reductase catalytic subunit